MRGGIAPSPQALSVSNREIGGINLRFVKRIICLLLILSCVLFTGCNSILYNGNLKVEPYAPPTLPVDISQTVEKKGEEVQQLELDEKYEIVSVGPTTSMRMEKFEYEFVEATGVRVIVGKGGMKENTERACKDFGTIHCVFPAGNAVVAAVEVEEVVEAQWKDLGMPETLWHCHVKEFGPLIVSIDSYGRNYFEEKKIEYNLVKK